MAKKRKSFKHKVLEGGRSKTPLTGKLKDSPPLAKETPWEPPSWIGPHGKSFHEQHYQYAVTMGTLSEADEFRWFLLCGRWQRVMQCEEELAKRGMILPGRGEETKANPVLSALKSEIGILLSEMDGFGLGFEARESMGLNLYPEEDDLFSGIWVD